MSDLTAPDTDRIRVALDNMIRHHNATRVQNGTHARPDRCEFVEQALAALFDSTPSAPTLASPTRLDERRLARAMGWGPGPVSGPELARAHRVAVKYAALEEKP